MRAVDQDGAYANLELPRELRAKGVRGRDAAFATELTYGATRMRGLYDPVIAVAAGRAPAQIDANVLDTLRLGVHQILGMRVPAHAAVGETVALARMVNGAGASGFVNAVLRRVGERSRGEWIEEVAGAGEPLARLAVEYSHPEWVVRAFRAALLGSSASSPGTLDADLIALLASDNAAAKVSLVARPGLADVEELIAAGARRSLLSPVGAVLPSGDPGAIPAVREGRAGVQDEASQLLALALAAAETVRDPAEDRLAVAGPGVAVPGTVVPGERWLDLCAGPGGKAALLATLGSARGASLVAGEISPHRAELVRQTLGAARAAGARVEVRVGDGREAGRDEPSAYDRVLVDAPCTGLGALRRRPEARWRRGLDDLPGLGALQRALLGSALDAVRPGGVVGYATCSPHLAETRFVVGDVTKRRSDVEIVDARPLFVDPGGRRLPDTGAGPYVQLWPHVHGTDAMFFALLRKRPV